jgi:hypothetical protein
MPTPSRRRWFQFSLASLLWLILTVALALLYVKEHRHRLSVERELELSKPDVLGIDDNKG